MRLVQIRKGQERRVAMVDEPKLRLLGGCSSIYELANAAIGAARKLADAARERLTFDTLEYDPIYAGRSDWRLLPAMDHPIEPARCLVSGTGLTHIGSARGRQSMHATAEESVTDSLRMFQWGVKGGCPADGCIGTSPEWFHKGTGISVRAHGEALTVPAYALDGGEEAEVAAVYVISADGAPYRVGMASGNEFSDHQLEKMNYLYLASSKMRECAIGPELVLDPNFSSVAAKVAIERSGRKQWSRQFLTGEANMCHSVRNMEHHLFKFGAHRRPGDVHIHFFGTDALSYSDGLRLEDGDIMQIEFEGFGRALRNAVSVDRSAQQFVRVNYL